MEYRSCIIDECGTVRAYCSEMSNDELADLLEQHPEWSITCILV